MTYIATNRRLVAPAISRLFVFSCVSLSLHALTLGVSAPGRPSASLFAADTDHGVLHAVLSPAPSVPATPEVALSMSGEQLDNARTDTSLQTTTDAMNLSEMQGSQNRGPRAESKAGLDLPPPDKWYAAAELDVRADPLTPVQLIYPPELAGTLMMGRVRIALFIDERGVVRKTQVILSQPEGVFDQAAIRTWQDVRFSSAMKNGIAVKSEKIVELDFQPI